MKLATWNVNSLELRLPHVVAWVGAKAPDILCLRELKCDDPQFPQLEIEAAGYRAVYSRQKA